MAEPLKNHFGAEIPKTIGRMISEVYPSFPVSRFVRHSLEKYEALDLMARGAKIANSLREHLPSDYGMAAEILRESLGPKLSKTDGSGFAPFLYLPHVIFVREHGLADFEESMLFQYELTQRFTAEFSIRRFLEERPAETLKRLRSWANDKSEHVRRLVSEGTRPRLPWAPRLRNFQKDPSPVLRLLELLKDDPSPYVRRSVANNLNDIGKDHPELLVATCKKWLVGASGERRALVRHALRSAVKRGDSEALGVMGYRPVTHVAVVSSDIAPKRAKVGTSVVVGIEIENRGDRDERILVDFSIGFVKKNGSSSQKVFKLRELTLEPGARASLSKRVSLMQLTTRKHYPGRHIVQAIVNGVAVPLGAFVLTE